VISQDRLDRISLLRIPTFFENLDGLNRTRLFFSVG